MLCLFLSFFVVASLFDFYFLWCCTVVRCCVLSCETVYLAFPDICAYTYPARDRVLLSALIRFVFIERSALGAGRGAGRCAVPATESRRVDRGSEGSNMNQGPSGEVVRPQEPSPVGANQPSQITTRHYTLQVRV